MDPSALFDIRLQKFKADAYKNRDGHKKTHILFVDLGSLDRYRKTYNTIHGCDLTLRKVMSRCIRDDAELASILSILTYDMKNNEYVMSVRMEPIS